MLKNFKDSYKTLRGEVTILDKLPDGSEVELLRKNLIVYQGRQWLLERAFGPQLGGAIQNNYEKTLKWFGLGQGGGEPGNPLQAGATAPWDTDLHDPILIKDGGTSPDYAPRNIVGVGSVDGYFKAFSSVYRKQDFANSYIIGNSEYYPEIIAEIRIDVGKTEAMGDESDPTSYVDLNEAGLFFGDVLGEDAVEETGTFDVVEIVKIDETTARYILASGSDLEDPIEFELGDYAEIQGAEIDAGSMGNNSDKTPIIKMGSQFDTDCKAYVEITNATAQDYTYSSNFPELRLTKRQGFNDIALFSRVTFSTIRKTSDREIVFLWKIYF